MILKPLSTAPRARTGPADGERPAACYDEPGGQAGIRDMPDPRELAGGQRASSQRRASPAPHDPHPDGELSLRALRHLKRRHGLG